jgi:ABC-2 type transport system ATP-binding protein
MDSRVHRGPDAVVSARHDDLCMNAQLTVAPAQEPGPIASSVVVLDDVHKRYGSVEALRDISLRVDAREVVAVLGPNGAGKTTAIGIMLGLRPATSGRVRILGGEPGSKAVRSRVGAMLQESGVPATLKVQEIVDLFRSYYPRALPRDVVLDAAGLTELAAKRVGALSGGQKQRLYFAIAICGDPDLLFLDEPTTGMDIESRHRFWERIRAFASLGKTILFTTHLLEEADAVATRIVVIDHGRVVAEGSPAELKARNGGKRIRLRGPFAPDEIAAWPGVTRATAVGGVVHIEVTDTTPVMRRIFADGRIVEEVTVEDAGLESAFLTLTRDTEGHR